MPEKKKIILFIFNQLLSGTTLAGGEVRAFKILQFFNDDQEFTVNIMLPRKAVVNIERNKTYYVGENFIENWLYTKNLQGRFLSIFILYIMRTFESLKHIKNIDADIVYSTGDFFCDTIPAFIIKKIRPKIKWVCCSHHITEAPLGRRQVSFINALVSYLSQRLSFLLIRISGDQVFLSNSLVKQHLIGFGISAAKISVIGNGFDIEKMGILREKYRNIQKENKISFFSRLSSSKGVWDLPEILFEVLKKSPDTKLEIIGGADKDILEKIHERFNKYQCDSKVSVLGFIEDKDEAFKIMMSSKMIIFPTYEEGWGFCLFEAILLKLPVVVYKLPIFNELFDGSILSVAVGDRKKFAEEILFCLDPSNARVVSEAVEKCYDIAKKYDWKDIANSEKQRILSLL